MNVLSTDHGTDHQSSAIGQHYQGDEWQAWNSTYPPAAGTGTYRIGS
jgi:hypothetical protein